MVEKCGSRLKITIIILLISSVSPAKEVTCVNLEKKSTTGLSPRESRESSGLSPPSESNEIFRLTSYFWFWWSWSSQSLLLSMVNRRCCIILWSTLYSLTYCVYYPRQWLPSHITQRHTHMPALPRKYLYVAFIKKINLSTHPPAPCQHKKRPWKTSISLFDEKLLFLKCLKWARRGVVKKDTL